jgi:hypothetical protein
MEISDNGNELTPFENVCEILADLGLPLAFLIDSELVIPTELAKRYIQETWEILLNSLEIDQDTGFDSLEDLFNYSKMEEN